MVVNIFYLIAILLMIFGACGASVSYGNPTKKIELWQLGWAFVIIAIAFGGYLVHL